MKKLLVITALLLFAGIAFGQTSKTTQVDFETEKAAVADLFDKYYSAINAKDAATLATFLTEDVLVCGTDPSEFWNKEQITDAWTQGLADTTLEINITIGKREIRVADDGSSVIVVEEYILPKLDEIESLEDCIAFYGQFKFWGENLKRQIKQHELLET